MSAVLFHVCEKFNPPIVICYYSYLYLKNINCDCSTLNFSLKFDCIHNLMVYLNCSLSPYLLYVTEL